MLPLVTIEEAIDLKKMGFDWEVNHYYAGNRCRRSEQEENHNGMSVLAIHKFSAPTVSEALLWLEDNKGFRFGNSITFNNLLGVDEWSVDVYPKNDIVNYTTFRGYNSRLFQSKQLSMALEILKTEKPTK